MQYLSGYFRNRYFATTYLWESDGQYVHLSGFLGLGYY